MTYVYCALAALAGFWVGYLVGGFSMLRTYKRALLGY